MKYAIIVSKKDIAGMNIKDCLLEGYGFTKNGEFRGNSKYTYENMALYTLDEETVLSEGIDGELDEDILVFATRHQSSEGVHSLSCHTPGVYGKADFGGRDKELCVALPLMLKAAYSLMKKNSDLDSNVTLECTHHGPYLTKPSMFIEIGSSEEEWKNKVFGKIIAKTIVELLNSKLENKEVAVGIGGPHYCNNFNKILERTELTLGHIIPKYALDYFSEELLLQMMERSVPSATKVIVDYKGLGAHKEKVKSVLGKLGLEYGRAEKILKSL